MKVKMSVGLFVDFTHSGGKEYYAETDSQERFRFVRIRGAGAGFDFEKPGYKYNLRLPSSSCPENYAPDPDHPIVFTMWKLQGAEPMASAKLDDTIPCDGTPVSYNLLTGKRAPNGDMIVKLIRSPVNIVRGKPFDWTLQLEIQNGGLVEQSDAYPNQAPAEGYQSSVTIDMPAKGASWTEHLTRPFYFKSRGGQNYGRMTIEIYADFQPSPTVFSALIYANPSGSRNLEFDSTKQINAK